MAVAHPLVFQPTTAGGARTALVITMSTIIMMIHTADETGAGTVVVRTTDGDMGEKELETGANPVERPTSSGSGRCPMCSRTGLGPSFHSIE